MERAGAAGVTAAGEGVAAAPTAVVKSCKGSLFYSSVLRSKGRGPICVGVSRSFIHVPDREVRDLGLGSIEEGRHLSNFKYSCSGCSLYLDDKDNPPGKGEKHAQLPRCTGFEILKTEHLLNKDQAVAHIEKEATQAQANKPGEKGDAFLIKFQRRGGHVAWFETYVEDSVDDVLDPSRKRPK